MRKFLLAAALTSLVLGDVLADNRTYTYSYYNEDFEEEMLYIGALRRVSPNGRWVVGGDDDGSVGGYLIDTDEPELINFTPDGALMDVNNDGLAVGTYFLRAEGGGVYKKAGIYRNGEWAQLPVPEESKGTSQAIAISADSRRIAGHALCKSTDPNEPGRYYPLTWKLNESTGEYEVERLYNDIRVPGAYGFFVYTMTPDGRYIGGLQNLDMGDNIAALLEVETGELTIWHNIEIRSWWFDNPGGYYDTMFVDNMMDGWDADNEYLVGMFMYSNNRYIFGSHGVVTEVNVETGEGHVVNYPAVYDIQEKKMIDGDPDQIMYLCGTGPEEAFTVTGELVRGDEVLDINKVINGPDRVDAVYGIDETGKVLAGSQVFFDPLEGYVETPVLVLLEEPALGGVKGVAGETVRPVVRVNGGLISVEGARKADIYTPDGARVVSGLNAQVAPGLYIVVADGTSSKIIVK